MFKSNKGISTPIGILIIVIVALLVGGILAWQYWWLPREEVKLPELKPPEKKVDETAAWKTYRNEKYGFEVKYPPHWLNPYNQGPTVITFEKPRDGIKPDFFTITILELDDPYVEWVKQNVSSPPNCNEGPYGDGPVCSTGKSIPVGSLMAIEIRSCSPMTCFLQLLIGRDKLAYYISLSPQMKQKVKTN